MEQQQEKAPLIIIIVDYLLGTKNTVRVMNDF